MRSAFKLLMASSLLAATDMALGAPDTLPPMNDNPFFAESPLDFHMPAFDRIKDSDYAPAFDRGMAEQMREVEAIASNPDQPTFDNTIVALERSGRILARVRPVFSNLRDANTDDAMEAIEREYAPLLSAHDDAIHLDTPLFARIQNLYARRQSLGLDPESLRLLERYREEFILAGAELSDADKARLKAMNAELASLIAAFSRNVLKEMNASSVVVGDRSELSGLPDAEIARLAAAAAAEGKPGQYLIRLVNTTGQPELKLLENRALRQRIFEASLARGSRGGPYDNQAVVARTVEVRAEKAALLGFDSFAAYKVENQTARTVGAVDALLAQLTGPALARARAEAAAMQALVDRGHGNFQLAPWDWDFYSEKVRMARYDFDESQIKPYFELNRVLFDGVFFAAHQLYGITFKERDDLPVYQPDVRVFEVFDSDGSPRALLLEDFYARPNKKGGAWMFQYVGQSGLLGTLPVVANHHNIPKPTPGQPTLLTFDEVVVLFHEFGHGLHGIFSQVQYPKFSGTQVPRDFVEYPSQVNEMWAAWPEVVRNYAKHYKTGEPMPEALLDKVVATQKFNQGFVTTEYLKATLLDWALHTLGPGRTPTDLPAFEDATFKRYAVDFALVPSRYRSTYFSHIFVNNYAANYYSYIWADVMVADSIEWFTRNGGLTRANGDRFRRMVLSRGGSEEALTLFRNFGGTDPDVGPLIRKRGLDEPGN
jgi:peptidyl-dipeptidase Dcp